MGLFSRQKYKNWQKATLGKIERKEDVLARQQKLSNALTRHCIAVAVLLLFTFLVIEPCLWGGQLEKNGVPVAIYASLVLFSGIIGWAGLIQLFPEIVSTVASFHRLIMICGVYALLAKTVLLLDFPRFVAPLALLSMTSTVMYSKQIGVYLTCAFAIMTGFMSGVELEVAGWSGQSPPAVLGVAEDLPFPPFDLLLFLSLLLGGSVAALGTGRLRSHGRLVTMGLATGLIQAVTVLGGEQVAGPPGSEDLAAQYRWLTPGGFDALCAFANGLLCGAVMTGLLPALEYFFGVVTERRLRELADLTSDVLRTLALRAPGSFTHSQNVAHLASEAAAYIDADPLLARVGAYYHDIGKIYKPEYFIENLAGGPNPHDKLSPEMSRLIIISHVKDGLGMAREEGLPWKVAAMIPMHHGTSVVKYFYQKAKGQADVGGRHETEMESYRYPGPKPTFKEAAILMLADVLEAASRTFTHPTAPRLKSLVHEVIMSRLREGELDDSELTIRDLSRIETSFLRTLSTQIFHGRIPYQKENEPSRETRKKKTGSRPGRSSAGP